MTRRTKFDISTFGVIFFLSINIWLLNPITTENSPHQISIGPVTRVMVAFMSSSVANIFHKQQPSRSDHFVFTFAQVKWYQINKWRNCSFSPHGHHNIPLHQLSIKIDPQWISLHMLFVKHYRHGEWVAERASPSQPITTMNQSLN